MQVRFAGAGTHRSLPARNRGRSFRLVLGLLCVVYLATIFAGFLAPHDPATQHRDLVFAPPTRLHFTDPTGRLHVRPFVYGVASRPGAFQEYEEDRSRLYPVR